MSTSTMSITHHHHHHHHHLYPNPNPNPNPLPTFAPTSDPDSDSHSDPDPDPDSDTESDSTLEDDDHLFDFGCPLRRMSIVDHDGRHCASDSDAGMVMGMGMGMGAFELYGCPSSVSSASSLAHEMIDFEALVDDLIASNPASTLRPADLIIVEPSTPLARDSVMLKSLPRDAPELRLLLDLNDGETRLDPWNPAPRVLAAVPRAERVFLCLERLHPFDQPPFQTIAHYIDFFRQCLEGLTFLHEHGIVHLGYDQPSAFMMAICAPTPDAFDRSKYPVRYYYPHLSHATRLDSPHPTASQCKRDVKECGAMLDRLLDNLPKVGPKMKTLTKAMSSGEFCAEDSRKLFEALCKSLEAAVFDNPVDA